MSSLAQVLRLSPLPLLESRMLMERVTGFTRIQLLTRDAEPLSAAQLMQWNDLLQRRLAGEPMAYILGEREFFGRVFVVNEHVLIPRADTETLIDTVLQQHQEQAQQNQPLKVLDLGTGSGAIAITLAAERPLWQVTTLDVSVEALQVAQENANRCAVNIRFLLSDWFTVLEDASEQFDILVSNPPYIAADDAHLTQGDLRFEPRHALSDEADGLQHYQKIIAHSPQYLRAGGRLYFEHGYEQAVPIRELLQQSGFIDIQTVRDLAGLDRVTFATWPSVQSSGASNGT